MDHRGQEEGAGCRKRSAEHEHGERTEERAVVGAGVIGSEFSFIYRAFGAEVTMVEMMPHAISTEDEEMAELLERELKKAKIKLIANAKVEKVEKGTDGVLAVKLSNGHELGVDMVLVSIGRTMNSDGLFLEDIGVARGKRGEIIVDERMETSVPGVYAIGDVTGKIMLAHVASHQGLVAVKNALGGDENMDYSVLPSCIFTMPEIGSVGIREKTAVEKGMKYRAGRFHYRALGKAHAMGEIAGMIKILADEATDKVLGVHICGAHATDMIHEGALAIQMGATAAQLGHMIHAHPTLAEGIMEAAESVHGMAIHIPKPEK